MSNPFSKLLTGALVTGLLAGSMAFADDDKAAEAAPAADDQAAHGKKDGCKGKKNKCGGKSGCGGKKEKKKHHHDDMDHHE
jgi:hypothetical protein